MVTDAHRAFCPYGPPSSVNAVLRRLHGKNIPERITREVLRDTGVSANIVPRIFATLRFLKLTDHNDRPTDSLRALASSTNPGYKRFLEKTVRDAYKEVFEEIDPGGALQDQIEEVFGRYSPTSQHSRQVTLFLGLCKEAGIQTLDPPRERRMLERAPSSRAARATPQQAQRGTRTARVGSPDEELGAVEQFIGMRLEEAASMPESQFQEVWHSLGILFRRRGQRLYPDEQETPSDSAQPEETSHLRE